ncbi:MAG TPA: hypothetical protein VH744_03400 [Terriglobales bacterium]
MPTRKCEDGSWFHPARLPLGGGWLGCCSAPGHEGAQPADRDLKESCNLGYAVHCAWLPAERACDAVRFSIVSDRDSRIVLCFVLEVAHRPAGHGVLQYDVASGLWPEAHPDPRVQRLAECYLESYLGRRVPAATGTSQ